MLDEKRLKGKVRDKEAYLNLLEELDRVGKFRKASYKVRVTFTIDEGLMNGFRRRCGKEHLSMSGLVESWIKEYMDKSGVTR